jgi:hypothetical protein
VDENIPLVISDPFTGRNADLGSNVRNLAADVRDLRNILRDAGYDRSLVNQQMQRLIELNRQVGNVPP